MEILSENQKIRYIDRVVEFKAILPVNHEVLITEEEIADRKYKLKKAFVYATRFNIKAEILIATKKHSPVKVISLIYEANDNCIKLKGSVWIPVSCILKVEYVY